MTTTAPKPPRTPAHTRTHWSLVRRLKAGADEQAWQEFYDRYGPLLRSLAVKSGLTSAEAEDALQETVASVFHHLPKFRADPEAGSFKNWLFRLAQWRIINQFKKRPRYRGMDATAAAADRGGSSRGTDPIEKIPDPATNAMEQVWEQEWRENALNLALERLREVAQPRHFQMFYLHVIKRQPPGDVARALGVSLGQVYLVKCRLLPRFKRITREISAGRD